MPKILYRQQLGALHTVIATKKSASSRLKLLRLLNACRLDSAYDCTSSASSSCNFCADEYDIPILNELPAAKAALSTGGHGEALRRRRIINTGENVNADGRAHRRHEDFMGGGAEAASATAAAASADVDDAASGGSFSDSDDVIFGADDSSPSPMSVAQAARLGLHIALDTCGDRLTPDQLHFLAGECGLDGSCVYIYAAK